MSNSNETEEKRSMILATLSFLVQERNKTLFQLSTLKNYEKEFQKQFSIAKRNLLTRNRIFKQRILTELDSHRDVLTKEDRQRYVAESPEPPEEV